MTQITTQSIIDTLNGIDKMKSSLNIELINKEQELKNLALYSEIKELELSIKQLEKQEEEVKEQGKQIMLNAGLKKFEALDGTVIQLNKKPGALIIENEELIPKEYLKEKTTVSVDKTTLKKDILEGLIIDGCYISEDYSLVIKNS